MTASRVRMAEDGPTFSRFAQGFGSAARWGKGPREVVEHMAACVDLGITTMDVAAIYSGGRAETLLGDALALDRSLRRRVEIVTKCGIGTWNTSLYHYDSSQAHIVQSVEESLTRLQTDHVDALLIHRPDPLMDADEVADTFESLRKSGKVRHFGVSNFSPPQFELLSSRLDFPLITNEIQVSVMHRDAFHDGSLDLCHQRRISPMAWGPLGGGRLFGDDTEQGIRLRNELESIGQSLGALIDQVALAWLLKLPCRPVPILGTGKIERVREAVRAEDLDLTREQWFSIWVAFTGERLP
jgi:predicted oxidoreductase